MFLLLALVLKRLATVVQHLYGMSTASEDVQSTRGVTLWLSLSDSWFVSPSATRFTLGRPATTNRHRLEAELGADV